MSYGKMYEYEIKKADGSVITLESYKDKVLLIVNTASKCGFTHQYKGLEELHKKYKDQGLVVLGFPCNQFAHQEPGSDAEIQNFCALNFGVSFPVMAKIDVNGKNAHPLFAELKKRTKGLLGDTVKWNFTKFLVSPNGEKIKRFEPTVEPEKMEEDIKSLLGK
ncbi:MAG: glutathione peroxidase [Spirochaetia bacterium]|jgi:glutathione peroxidase|nr:glutathione peroxidase [Spirochaetia bacterium]